MFEWLGRKFSPLKNRDPLSLQQLSKSFHLLLPQSEILKALQVIERFLGDEVRYFRPGDRLDAELGYITKGLEGNALDRLGDWIIDTYRLNQRQIESLDAHCNTVQDLVEILCILLNQSPEKADLSLFLRKRESDS